MVLLVCHNRRGRDGRDNARVNTTAPLGHKRSCLNSLRVNRHKRVSRTHDLSDCYSRRPVSEKHYSRHETESLYKGRVAIDPTLRLISRIPDSRRKHHGGHPSPKLVEFKREELYTLGTLIDCIPNSKSPFMNSTDFFHPPKNRGPLSYKVFRADRIGKSETMTRQEPTIDRIDMLAASCSQARGLNGSLMNGRIASCLSRGSSDRNCLTISLEWIRFPGGSHVSLSGEYPFQRTRNLGLFLPRST